MQPNNDNKHKLKTCKLNQLVRTKKNDRSVEAVGACYVVVFVESNSGIYTNFR